jgi:DNA primase
MASQEELRRAIGAAAWFYWHELRDRPNSWAGQHLRNRGVDEEILSGAIGWWLGYAPDSWTGLVDRLRRDGFDDRTLLAAGLATTTINGYLIDRFRDRVMFVAEDRLLNPVGFVGRSRGGRVRYLNSPNTEIYSKARALVGLHALQEGLVDGAIPVVVEGPMDALAVGQLGGRWVGVSGCGTAISREQAGMLRRFSSLDTVVVAFDGDTGGRNGAVRNLGVLSEFFSAVLVAELPAEHDPSSLFQADPDRLHDVLTHTRPLAQFAIDVELARWDRVLDHLSGQVNAVRAVAPLVGQLPAGLVAGEVARLSRRVGLEEQIVSREVLAAVGLRKDQRPGSRRPDNLYVGVDPPDVSRTP